MNVVSMVNVNRVENGQGTSEIVVTLDDGTTRTYDVVSGLAMRSYKHANGAIDDASAYQFTDNDGVLVITPKGEQADVSV